MSTVALLIFNNLLDGMNVTDVGKCLYFGTDYQWLALLWIKLSVNLRFGKHAWKQLGNKSLKGKIRTAQ